MGLQGVPGPGRENVLSDRAWGQRDSQGGSRASFQCPGEKLWVVPNHWAELLSLGNSQIQPKRPWGDPPPFFSFRFSSRSEHNSRLTTWNSAWLTGIMEPIRLFCRLSSSSKRLPCFPLGQSNVVPTPCNFPWVKNKWRQGGVGGGRWVWGHKCSNN